MLDSVFGGLFDSAGVSVISLSEFLICVCSSLVIGLILAWCYMYRSRYTKGFVATLALLPAVVAVVIMMVNGNIGTGVAVAGAFSLVRFRSAAGSAKEIGAIFLAMATGLLAGMGYIGYALLCAVILGGIGMLYSQMDFGTRKNASIYKTMHITIPEDLDYNDVFEPILKEFTESFELIQVKTTNMGSLFRLTYDLTLKNPLQEKDMIDRLRIHNGNLEITISRQQTVTNEL